MAVSIYTPTSNVWESQVLYILNNWHCLLNFSYSGEYIPCLLRSLTIKFPRFQRLAAKLGQVRERNILMLCGKYPKVYSVLPCHLQREYWKKFSESNHLNANKQLYKSRKWLMWPISICEKDLWVIVDTKLNLCQQNDETILCISCPPLPLDKMYFLLRTRMSPSWEVMVPLFLTLLEH